MEKNKLALLSDTHLAGCVMVDGAKREAQLISMCTGSYAGPQIYNNGEDVRDCDALVLCKRGLQKFLMKEVCVFYTKESASIFYQQQESGKLALRLNISFHMYTNYNPLPSEQSISLRTKRTVGANKFAPRKFVPLSMVTADKMLKWNVMGVQGAILSQSMDPVFISSFIINARADHDELYKMICGRYPSKNVEDRRIICPKIVVMQPQAPYTLDIEPYSPGERYAVMWNITNPEDIELVSCTSGYCWDGTPSKISDIGLLEEIKNIYTIMGIDIGNPTYNDVKYTLNTKNYFSAMDRVKQAFRSSQMGNWVEKTRRIVEN
ncbi:unnamed protein product [Bursaphelenchus okinawaensis]|uniref:A to I editase domain-containing protein n=1 Tax=Bursaphelenchus okinawaensis TaxID=465554 RepID=A0A811L118_9BILA|nr:unnamed protein product [Bursaphelenchus okinawaensis]CAG9114180.1 unnamed protein product [Bursaphelenchus okinawaensis]